MAIREEVAPWLDALHKGYFPQLDEEALKRLYWGLSEEHPGITHGTFCRIRSSGERKGEVTAVCVWIFPWWSQGGWVTGGACNDLYAEVMYEVDRKFREPVSHRLIAWWDDGDRESVRQALLEEVREEVRRRGIL